MTVTVIGDNTGDSAPGSIACTFIDGAAGTGSNQSGQTYVAVAEKTVIAIGQRGLMKVSNIRSTLGAGRSISTVTLTWPTSNSGGGANVTIVLCPMLRAFVTAQCTDLIYAAASNWQTALAQGALDAGASVATDIRADFTTYVWASTTALVALVQAAYDGSADLNLLIRAVDGLDTSFRLFTKPGSADGSRPFLTITHTAAASSAPSGFKKMLLLMGYFSGSASAAVSGAPTDIAGPAGALSLPVTFDQSDTNADGSSPLTDNYGYGMLYGTVSGGPYPYRKVLVDSTAGPGKTIIAGSLASGTYYIVVVAYDTLYNVSYQSSEISKAAA